MLSRSAAGLLIFTSIAFATAARADDAGQARAHFAKGTTLYDLGQYKEAAQEYEAAYRYKSDPALLFNIGQAYRFAGANADALRSYRAYLRHVPDAANRAEVEAYLGKLQKLIDEQKTTSTSPPTGTLALTPEPPLRPATTPAVTATEHIPVYKKWWLWTAVGGVVVIGAAVALAVIYTTPNDAPAPSGALSVVFP